MALLALPILKRHARLQERRRLWEPTWEELAVYILPAKSGIGREVTPGAKKTDRLFDSAAPSANEDLASALHVALTSPSLLWFSLVVPLLEPAVPDELKRWLEQATRHMWAMLQASNLASAIHEVYLDLGCFGTACLYLDERPGGELRFCALPIGSYSIAENDREEVDTVFREFKLSARQAALRWGEPALSEAMRKRLEKEPDQETVILHAVFPRKDVRGDDGKPDTQLSWVSVYIDLDAKHLIEEGGYVEFPFLVARWTKASGEVYGRSPGFTALPDIKTLNEAKKLGLKAWAMAIQPPMKAKYDGTVGPIRLTPGAINYLRGEVGNDLQPIDSKSRFDVSQIQVQDLRRSIKEIFFGDVLRLPTGPPVPHMTAAEVYARREELMQAMGPAVGRLQDELLGPLVRRVFLLMRRAKHIPDPPVPIQAVSVQYEGPLSRAQRSHDVQAMERWVAGIMPLAQVDPSVLDIPDFDTIVRESGMQSGVPANAIRDLRAVKQRRDARAQQQAQQQALQTALSGSEAAKNIAPFIQAAQGAGAPGA